MMEPSKDDELRKTTLFIEQLASKEEKELTELMKVSPQEYAQLLKGVGALIDKACGNLNKLYEVVTQLELLLETDTAKCEIQHVKHEYSADLLLTNPETKEEQAFELKNSMVKKVNHYRTNWLFSVNEKVLRRYQEKGEAADLELLIGSLYEKQRNGVTAFIARSGSERLNLYKVNGAFVALYCIKSLISSSAHSINLGSERCPSCNHYHRLLHLQRYGQELERRIEASNERFLYKFDYFSAKEWIAIFRPVPSKSNCEVYGKDSGVREPTKSTTIKKET